MLIHSIRRGAARARQGLDDLAMLARLTRDLPAFLRASITMDACIAWQRERLATRDAWLLLVAEHQIYGFPRSGPKDSERYRLDREPQVLRALGW